MKRHYTLHSRKIWVVLAMLTTIGITVNATDYYPTNSTDLTTAITNSVDHDIIWLDPNVNYVNTGSNPITVTSKIITIRAITGATTKPHLTNYFFKVGSGTLTDTSGIFFDGLELDGASSSSYSFVLFSAGSVATFPNKVKFNDCYVHHNTRSVVLGTYYVDTLSVNNCVFYSTAGNTDTYPAFGNTSSAPWKYVSITNSTFSKIGGTFLRLSYNSGTVNQTVIIDHCTMDSLYAASRPFRLASGSTGTLSFTLSNSIISNCRNLTGLWANVLWGPSVSNVINTGYYKVRATDSIVTSAVTQTNFTYGNPQYEDSSKRDFTVYNLSLLTASTTGGLIGDPRWDPRPVDAYLTDITVNGNSLYGFKRKTLLYNVTLPLGTTNAPTVTTTKEWSEATVNQTAYGTDSTVILVTSKNGLVTKKYKLIYTIADPTTLTDLAFDGVSIIQAGVTKYGITLPKGTTTVPANSRFTYTTAVVTSTVNVTQAATLGDSTIVTVTSQDGSESRSYKIGFTVTPWNINVSASPVAGGTASLAGGKTNYQPNEVATLSAVANTGYYFTVWQNKTSGSVYSYHADTTLTVTQDSSLVAIFALKSFTVSAEVAPFAGGTISGIPASPVTYGSSVTLTASASAGYTFSSWAKGSTILGTNPVLTFTVSQDTAITANFIYTVGSRRIWIVHPGTDSIKYYAMTKPEVVAGDTIMLLEGSYTESTAISISKTLTIMADPDATTKPKVVMGGAFNFIVERISFRVKGIEFNGNNGGTSDQPNFFQSNVTTCDTFKTFKVENCVIYNYTRGFYFGRYTNTIVDTFMVNNLVMYNKNTNNLPTIALADKANIKYLSVTNSTFYNMVGGFLDNPQAGTSTTMTIIVDHNTFYNVINSNKSLIQTNTITNGNLTYSFTNNIVCRIKNDSVARPFWFSPTSGPVSVSNNCFYNFTPRIYLYSIDSLLTVTNDNVTTEANRFFYPSFRDTAAKDFTLPDSSKLLTASTAHGAIGDPRWAPAVHVGDYVAISPAGATVLLGNTQQFKATVSIAFATDTTVTWSVLNNQKGTTGEATIDQNGLLQPVAEGKVYVKIVSHYNPTLMDSVLVTIRQKVMVSAITVTGADVNGTAITTITNKGGYMIMKSAVLPADADDKTVTWSITNGVDANGKGKATLTKIGQNWEIIALASGSVTVRATANDGSGIYGEMTVPISGQVPVTKVTVAATGDVTTISTNGGTLQMIAATTPDTADNKAVTWSVDNTTLATVSETGLLTAKGNGTVKVMATSQENIYVKGSINIVLSNQVAIPTASAVSLQVTPNPAKDIIRVISEQPSEVTICNMLGSAELSARIDANGTLNIQRLNAGLYLVKIKSGEHVKTVRLLKE